MEGLDRINKLRRISFCVDLSATPYFLGRVGQEANRPFPWVVSDFSLTDAIESGLVKIPQLAVRDATGQAIPGDFNIWRWIMPQLTSAERGGRKSGPKPESILKYANTPIAMLGGLWEQLRVEWEAQRDESRPPVFILVYANTALAKVVEAWLGRNEPPPGIPPHGISGFLNSNERTNTIRVDSKVVEETDSDHPQSDDAQWLRFTLDTVGKMAWPADRVGRPIFPEGFAALAAKRGAPIHPPGRDIRCIVSVGMLTEGWDCNTVTHIVGLRPFMSQAAVRAGRRTRTAATHLRRRRQRPHDRGGCQGIRSMSKGALPRRTSHGEAPEVPRYEQNREAGSSADVDFPTTRDVREVLKSHVNYVVADTKRWEQSAAYILDTHQDVEAFVKNAGLGFAIPYLDNGQKHEFQPDFIVRFVDRPDFHLILETKGFDPRLDVKKAAAER